MDSNMQKEHFTLKDSVENEENLSTRLEPFFRDLDCFLDRELTTMIEKSTPKLLKELASVGGEQIADVTKQHIQSWRNGDIKTLDEVYRKISSACFEINMTGHGQQLIIQWAKGMVAKDITTEIKKICDKHATADLCGRCTLPPIRLASNNTTMNSSVIDETIPAIISVVTVMGGVKLFETISSVILQTLRERIDVALFAALVACGPVGFAVIASIVGATTGVVARDILDRFVAKVPSVNLRPLPFRALVTDAEIDEFFSKKGMEQVEEALSDPDFVRALSEEIAGCIRPGLRKRIAVERNRLACL